MVFLLFSLKAELKIHFQYSDFIKFCSDKPNEHDFALLKQLVLPNGFSPKSQVSGEAYQGLFVQRSCHGWENAKFLHLIIDHIQLIRVSFGEFQLVMYLSGF